jgi:hypothetical protein
MNRSKITLFATTTILVGCLLILFCTFAGLPPRTDASVPREVGRALAQEALKLFGPGKRLTVIARDTSVFKQPATDITLAAFEDEIRKGGAKITAVQLLQVDPLRPLQVPPGDFFELLRRGAAGDVIVSLMGPPQLSEEQRSALGNSKAKVVAFCPGGLSAYLDLHQLAGQKLLHAAILSRPLPPKPGALPIRERFDDLFERVGAAELEKRSTP